MNIGLLQMSNLRQKKDLFCSTKEDVNVHWAFNLIPVSLLIFLPGAREHLYHSFHSVSLWLRLWMPQIPPNSPGQVKQPHTLVLLMSLSARIFGPLVSCLLGRFTIQRRRWAVSVTWPLLCSGQPYILWQTANKLRLRKYGCIRQCGTEGLWLSFLFG